MEILILDTNFNSIKLIDSYYSLIWTIRYTSAGDFELYIPLDVSLFKFIKKDYYLYMKDSDRVMIIEDIKINSSEEDGLFLTVAGRSLESILTRRIVWDHTVLTGDLQTAIQKLLNENIISPSDQNRKIDNFIFGHSTDPYITSRTIDAQFMGEELYEVIQKLCEVENIGFKIALTDENEFKFQLYYGANRSYSQTSNPYVIFSPEFENLINSSYFESIVDYKTVALVGGEGEGNARKTITYERDTGAGEGLNRREVFTDASSVSTNSSNGTVSDTDYNEHMKTKGSEKLAEHDLQKIFESTADFNKTFKYGKDFDIGDVLQLRNEYGFEAVTRVTEIIFTQDIEGYNVFPTFEVEGQKGES